MEQFVDITGVEVVADHTLRVSFADGTIGDVGLADQEWQGVLEPLRDPAFFERVRVDPESGTVTWPNGVDLAPEPLYAEARRSSAERPSPRRG